MGTRINGAQNLGLAAEKGIGYKTFGLCLILAGGHGPAANAGNRDGSEVKEWVIRADLLCRQKVAIYFIVFVRRSSGLRCTHSKLYPFKGVGRIR